MKEEKQSNKKHIFKCSICGKPAGENSTICSERCKKISLKRLELVDKYFPANGCPNCLGDLHEGCTKKCKEEFRKMGEFSDDLWELLRLCFPKNERKN